MKRPTSALSLTEGWKRTLRTIFVLLSVLILGCSTCIPIANTHASTRLVVRNGHGASSTDPGKKISSYLKALAAKNRLTGAVLVARKGKILLAKGYGMADREDGVAYAPTTKAGFPGLTGVASIVAGLRLEAQGKLHDATRVCSYFSSCPATWKAMTVRMLLDGTSGLPDVPWGGKRGQTVGNTLTTCQLQPLIAFPDPKLRSGDCTGLVLGLIFQKVTGKPWARVMQQEILRPAGMKHSGRLTDALTAPARAKTYSGSEPNEQATYDDYLFLYSTALDVYAFDNALFGGKLLPRALLQRTLARRVAINPPDRHLGNAYRGYGWKIGSGFGRPLDYTYLGTAINLRFPRDGVTVIVVSNDNQVDVEDVAVHAAATVFGKTISAPPSPTAPAVNPAKAIVASVTVPSGFSSVAAGDGAVWVALGNAGSVLHIDPATNKVVATVKINDPADIPANDIGVALLAVGNGQVWATDRVNHAVVRIDPATNQIVARIGVGIVPFGLAIAGDTLWIDNSYEDAGVVVNTIVRVDLRSQKVVATITNADTNIGKPFQVLAASPTAVWFADWPTNTIKRLDPATNKVVATIKAGRQPVSLSLDNGALWVSDHDSNLVTRIDPAANKVVATIPLAGYTSGNVGEDCCFGQVSAGNGALWTIAGSGYRTLVRIDPETNKATGSLTFPDSISMVAIGDGGVWVLGNKLYRVDPATMK